MWVDECIDESKYGNLVRKDMDKDGHIMDGWTYIWTYE